MEKTIVFDCLKFNTSFKFKNSKERDNYFNNLLFDSVYLFKEQQKRYFSEKIHVYFSFSHIFKLSGMLSGVLSLLTMSTSVWPVFFILMIIQGLLSAYYYKKMTNSTFGFSFMLSLYEEDDFITTMKNEIEIGGKITYK